MSRIWVFIKESTLKAAIDVLKWWGYHTLEERKDAIDDFQRAKRLSDTKATREEIEHAIRTYDKEQPK